MKSTGIVRRIDPLGRVVLPKELRKTLDISEGDPLEIFTDEGMIILRKYQPACDYALQLARIRDNIAYDSSLDKPLKVAAVEALDRALKELGGSE